MVRFICFTSLIEPKNAKQEELEQFEQNDIWMVILRSSHTNVVGTK